MNTWLSSAVDSLSTHERNLVDTIAEALTSTGELQSILSHSFAELSKLIPSDCASLCVSNSNDGEPSFRWFPINFHPEWFSSYAAMAPHDFVRRSVTALPNVVLRDEDMLPRSLFENNFMYRRSREIGFPLEQVMAVSFASANGPVSGISLFRQSKRGFTQHEQQLMQMLSPIYYDRIRSCALLDHWSMKSAVFERLFGLNDAAVVAFAHDGRELFRSASTDDILRRWFGTDSRVPAHFRERIQRFADSLPFPSEPAAWVTPGDAADLVASLFDLELPGGYEANNRVACLVLREASHQIEPPALWRELLTKRELEVATYILRGCSNEAIAALSGCSPKTVKKHIEHIYDKLGVSSRAALCSLARRRG